MIAPLQMANAVAEALTGRGYLSHSAVTTYQQCPLRYYFRYVQGLEEKVVSASLVLGGAIHSAVEFHFNEVMAGNAAPDRDTLLGAFWSGWHSRGESAEIRFGKTDNLSSIAGAADRIIEAFRASDFARPQGHIIGVEEELRSELIPGLPQILGRIDLIVETEQSLKITDLKTARSRWTSDQARRSGEQLMLYAELARDLAPGKTVELEFCVATKGTNPTVECFQVPFSHVRVTRTKRTIERVWSAIQSGHFYPSPSAMTCPGCPFRVQCDAWTG